GVTDTAHARHLFLVQLPVDDIGQSRNDVLAALRSRNIGAGLHYQPIHTMPLYSSRRAMLPITERVAARILNMTISESIDAGDTRDVLAELDEVLSTRAVGQSTQTRKTA